MFQLRQDNIEELRQSVPFYQLPQVFQDAMYISIELGINYIWIDSLCTIQDSKEDWAYEARRMGKVYQYAACNIAASGYQESRNLGVFLDREAREQSRSHWFADCVLDFQNTEEPRPFKGLYVHAEEAGLLPAINGSSLNSRAWVAQERALSPGIIHLNPEMIWWECNHLVANEAFPTGIIPPEDGQLFNACTIRSLTVKSDAEDIYAFWRRFIGRYAGAELTYERDRFPAAVGIALTLSELINDNFIAGYWEGDLIKSLVMGRRGEIKDVPTTWRAPTWSWASLRAAYFSPPTDSDLQPLSGVSVRVLSDLPGFKTDLDLASLEISGVRGLKILAPLRKLPANIQAGLGKHSTWLDSVFIQNEIDNADCSGVDIPGDQAWRLRDATQMVVLVKSNRAQPRAIALLVQRVLEAEGHNTFRRQGWVYLGFRTNEKLEECLGLQKENEKYIPSPVLGDCGLQEVILI